MSRSSTSRPSVSSTLDDRLGASPSWPTSFGSDSDEGHQEGPQLRQGLRSLDAALRVSGSCIAAAQPTQGNLAQMGRNVEENERMMELFTQEDRKHRSMGRNEANARKLRESSWPLAALAELQSDLHKESVVEAERGDRGAADKSRSSFWLKSHCRRSSSAFGQLRSSPLRSTCPTRKTYACQPGDATPQRGSASRRSTYRGSAFVTPARRAAAARRPQYRRNPCVASLDGKQRHAQMGKAHQSANGDRRWADPPHACRAEVSGPTHGGDVRKSTAARVDA